VNLLASVDRSGRLIEQLLALARVDASASLPQRFAVVDLAPLVHAQIAEHERFAARRHVDIEASTEPARVRGDHELLGVLLRNLVDNAIRYSRPETRVVISCETRADGVELTINDEGVGIAPEERTRIFERFYRAGGTHDYGSGLGLSIVKRIADLHEARITVNTGASQRGTCFTLWFPRPAPERSH
jgi:signal transduction histidine kinase